MQNRPNILLIMTDQQRYDSLGYMHTGESYTPFLDQLAMRGTRFERAYSSSTACVPARVSLLTGLLPNRALLAPKFKALKEGYWTIARAFKNAGYETALYGKLHAEPMYADHGFEHKYLVEHLPSNYSRQDYDDYRTWLESKGHADVRFERPSTPSIFPYPEECHPTPWITQHFLDFMASRRKDQPYFAVVSYAHPHTPYDPPARYAQLYRAEDEPAPTTDFSVNLGLPPPFLHAANDRNDSGFFVPVRTHEMPRGHVATVKACIRALNRQIDDSIAQLMAKVDLSNTVVFFTSDHGDYGGERGFLGKTPWIPFDDLCRVPFFITGAGVPSGQTVRDPIQSFDYVPTALAFAGIEYPYAGWDSINLQVYLQAPDQQRHRPVFSETQMGFPMVLRDNIKDIWHDHSGTHLVFDLAADPKETTNLATDNRYKATLLENEKLISAVLSAEKLE